MGWPAGTTQYSAQILILQAQVGLVMNGIILSLNGGIGILLYM